MIQLGGRRYYYIGAVVINLKGRVWITRAVFGWVKRVCRMTPTDMTSGDTAQRGDMTSEQRSTWVNRIVIYAKRVK